MKNELHAVSPVDGRYFSKTQELSNYFSEYALIRYRLKVEVEYIRALRDLGISELSDLSKSDIQSIIYLVSTFNDVEAKKIREEALCRSNAQRQIELDRQHEAAAVAIAASNAPFSVPIYISDAGWVADETPRFELHDVRYLSE